MRDSMIERMARKLCEMQGRDPEKLCVGAGKAAGQIWLGWQAYIDDARTVLSVVREPTANMIEAGEREFNIVDDGIAQPLFSTMIDAALAEEE